MNNDAIYIGSELADKYLAHTGKGHKDGGKSGRYPYGSGERPFQREGGLKKDGLKKDSAVRRVGGRVVNMISSNAKKAVPVVGKVNSDEPQETKDQMKQRIIQRGKVSEVLTNSDLFTTNELNDYINRRKAISSIQNMAPRKKTISDRINDASKAVNTLVSAYDTGKRVWDRMRPGLEKVGLIEKKPEEVAFSSRLANEYLRQIKNGLNNGTISPDVIATYFKVVNNVSNIEAAASGKSNGKNK